MKGESFFSKVVGSTPSVLKEKVVKVGCSENFLEQLFRRPVSTINMSLCFEANTHHN